VAGRRDDGHFVGQPVLAVDEVKAVVLFQRQQVLFQVRRSRPLVGRDGGLPFVLHDEVRRVWEGRDHVLALPPRVPAAVVGVQVRVDHDVDLARLDAQLGEIGEQRAVLDGAGLLTPGVGLIADAGLDQDQLALRAQQHRVQRQRQPVTLVQRACERFPHDARHDAERGAGVGVEGAVREDREVEVAEAVLRGHLEDDSARGSSL
jgi:hypothetical protein